MKVEVHLGIVWAYKIAGGWFIHLKAFPEAVKKIKKKPKDEYVPDVDHATVLKYVKDHS